MTLFSGQASVPSSVGTIVCVVPPGPGEVVLSNLGPGVAYVGVVAGAGTVSPVTGFPIPSGAIASFSLHQGSGGGTLRAVAAGGTATATLGFIVSTAYGLAQPGTQ